MGYWSTHQFKKRSVESVSSFEGWKRIVSLAAEAGKTEITGQRDEALVCALFLTGGRVGEVVRSPYAGLLKENVIVKEDEGLLLFQNVRILKKYKKVEGYVDEQGKKHWKTQRVSAYRVFPVPLNEPLVPKFLDYCATIKEGLLFPICTTRAYQIVEVLDPSIWPHWFRSQRAAQLALEYGWELYTLMEFFDWKDLETAIRYASMGYKGLASKLPKQVARWW
ncbi:MAG TPA: hypothetical protein VIH27_07270 [Nitrososphaerales archaeon]